VTSSLTLGRILEGDTVFTSGGRTSLAPPDIPVGVVANVITRPGSGGTRLEILPAVNLSRLQFVRVVLYKPPVEVAR
jgi:cell shape-determining protein MreC